MQRDRCSGRVGGHKGERIDSNKGVCLRAREREGGVGGTEEGRRRENRSERGKEVQEILSFSSLPLSGEVFIPKKRK